MKESTTYQAILREGLQEGRQLGRLEGRQEGRQEGAVEEARKLLLWLGTKRLGRPSAGTKTTLKKITDLGRLETLFDRLGQVENWNALLTQIEVGENDQ